MDTTRAQQKALDDDLVASCSTNCLKNLIMQSLSLMTSSNLNSKEPTLQVALDAVKLTSFYKAFVITADVPEIYMQEDMLQICPKLPGQKFEDPPFEEEILSFIRELGQLVEIQEQRSWYKRSKTQFHNLTDSGSGADEGNVVTPRVPDIPTYDSEDEQISWKSSDEDDDDEVNLSEDDDDQDDDNEQTESNNDDDDFVYPKLSTFDEKERQDEEDKEEEWFDDEEYG
ncbi:hypothetical protein Tco_1243105 [Tanacetum coccineum]